jgi:hypothetical protein
MPALPLSGDMLNAAPVVPTLAGEMNTLGRSEPSTGQVASAYISDVFQGNGSLQQDIQRADFNNSLDTENAISPDEWKLSDNYRPGLNYYPGMTDKAAAILAQSEDDRKNREFVMGRASGWQTAAGFGAALGAGIFEPKNLASGAVAGMLTEGLGEVVPAFKRVIAIGGEIGKYKALAIRGATEGALATALTEPSNRESAKIMQSDYTMADSLLNFTLSTALGGALHAGIAKFKDVRAEGIKTPSEVPEVKVKEFDSALGQMAEGRRVDVEHVQEIDKGQAALRAQNDLPKINENIATVQAETGIRPVTESPEFKNWFGESKVVDENGAPQVVYHGTAGNFEAFSKERIGDLHSGYSIGYHFTNSPEEAHIYAKNAAINNEGANIIPSYVSTENPLVLDSKDMGASMFIDTNKAEIVEKLTKGKHDGLIVRSAGGSENIVVFKPEQIKSVFNRGAFDKNDPRLHDMQTLEQMQVKKGQAEADAKLTADSQPVINAATDSAKPDNSTAYSPKDINEVHDYLDQFAHEEDQAALEKSLQFMQEDIQAMKEEGLLSGEQLSMLDKLNEIDGDININESVLRSAFLCLTRG